MPLKSGSSGRFHVSRVMRVLAIAGLCIFTGSARNAIASETATWHDPSPHDITFVTVDDGVKLEVLDWGGNGRALVLLAGEPSILSLVRTSFAKRPRLGQVDRKTA